MADRRAPAAVGDFKAWIQLAVSSVTDGVITLSPNAYRPADVPHRMTLGVPIPTPLRASLPGGDARFGLSIIHVYRIVQPRERGHWKVQTAAYQYALDDADEREIFAYHWHPHIEDVPYPHLHISRGAVPRAIATGVELSLTQNPLLPQLADAHFPTRRIALEDMLRLLIEQFGVVPAREDWDEALRRARGSFASDRTWL